MSQVIISKSLDPIFAVSVGIAAFAVRVRREEKEKGRSFQDSVSSVRRRLDIAWNGDAATAAAAPAPAANKK